MNLYKLVETFLDAHVQIATIFVSVIKLRATMKKK